MALKIWYKIKKPVSVVAFITGILLMVVSVLFDLTYSGRMNCACIENMIEWIKKCLMPVGFRYHIAYEIISGSMGISFTSLSLLLNMGMNISNRFEIKIFGIPRWELKVSYAHKIYNWFHILIYSFPFIMLICINLRLCVLGYLVLVYNLILLIMDYIIITGSYKWEKNVEYATNKLIKVFDDSEKKLESDYMEYQTWLGEVRLGIERKEGWEKAGHLFECFVRKVSSFENERSYISCCFFFDIIFCKDNQGELRKEAPQYVKRYVHMLYERQTQSWSETVFCALLKVIIRYWNESQISEFLNWFLDFASRRNGGAPERISYINSKQVMQINIVMVMIEEWYTHQKEYEGSLDKYLDSLWFQGDLSADEEGLCLELFEIAHNTEEKLRYKQDNTVEAYINLRDDYRNNRGLSFIGDFIRRKK